METLLIIEDEKLLGSELSRHYQKLGWDVILASNLYEASAILRNYQSEPLLIISDMNLPDGNALDLMEQIKKGSGIGGSMRIDNGGIAEWLFLTGFGSVPDSVRALRLGAYDFLEKPCDLAHLRCEAGSRVVPRSDRAVRFHVRAEGAE
jgi:DNA-binding response OmpR family regulator